MSSQRFGPYYLLERLGQGAMGEVYRARDSKLGREVALKLLPRELTNDPDRRSRFEREARMLAALNHANIATIYGLEEGALVGDDGVSEAAPEYAIVMELVAGATLEEKLNAGALPMLQALDVARQIAAALEAAHEKGVIHRDLKPANIAITPSGVVKVLDFGLAKITEVETGGAEAQTMIAERTEVGTVLGTTAYMSPEQARGQPVDRRTDVWSFGCVLYEILTGQSAFAGPTDTDTIVAFMSREPDWSALPAATPPSVQRVLQRCLAKDRERRLRDIAEARIEIDDALGALGSPRARAQRRVAWLAVAAGVALLGVAGWLLDARVPTPVTSPSEYEQLTNLADSAVAPALSPDGSMVTFKVGNDFFLSRGHIYAKQLPTGDAVQLTREPAVRYGPVFTPDGSRVTYTQLVLTAGGGSWDTHSVPVLGGEPSTFLPNASGLTWLDDGRVVFAEIASGLHMGIVATTESRTDRQEIYWPEHGLGMAHYAWASPDREWVLVVEMDQSHVFHERCRVVPFDGSSRGRAVGPDGTCTSAAWSPDGEWMYFGAHVDGSSHLWRQRFPEGRPEQITFGPTEEEGVAVAPDGKSLVTSLGMRRSSIWLHERGEDRPIVSEGYSYAARLSADTQRAYYLLKQTSSSAAGALRVVDIASGRTETVLSDTVIVDYDVSLDETEVAYTTRDAAGEPQVWVTPVSRLTPPRLIASNADQVSFGAGREVIFRSLAGAANTLVRASSDGSSPPERLETPAVHDKGDVSPDGRWVVVLSPGDGHESSAALAVPLDGGTATTLLCTAYCWPTWSQDGRFWYVPVGAGGLSAPSATYVFRLPDGQLIPQLPPWDINANLPASAVSGAQVIDQGFVALGSEPSRYVFTKVEFHRNLFRIPLR